MKAVKIYQAGGPKQLIYQDVPMPDVKDGCFWCKQRDDFLHLPKLLEREPRHFLKLNFQTALIIFIG